MGPMSVIRYAWLVGLFSPLLSAAKPVAPAVADNYARLPLAFEKHGERFVAHGLGYSVGIDSGRAVIEVFSEKKQPSHAISLEFAGSRLCHAMPSAELSGKVNYILGNDPAKWQTGLPIYGRVTCSDTYPGIDIVYYGNQRQLEFDFVVKPGANPNAIRMRIAGAARLTIDASGALDIDGADGLRIPLPVIYQEIGGKRRSISGHYTLSRREVSFRVHDYDRGKDLVIDPTIVYSTLLGGGRANTGATTFGAGIAVDSSGNVLIAGGTYATDFPVVNAAQSPLTSTEAGFVAKMNAAGTALIYSTYLGGTDSFSSSSINALAVDATGSAWVAGITSSSSFPALNAAQPAFSGESDAVVAKLNASGVLQFSTYLGGTGISLTYASGVAVDRSGNGYITGYTEGPFPVTGGALQASTQSERPFVTKYSSAGAIVYSATTGGGNLDTAQAIAVDSAGNAYITGTGNSATFTAAPAGGAQATNNGNGDAFVAKLNANGAALLYFTFLGGTGADQGETIAVDAAGNAYIAGQTGSDGLATPGAAQTSRAGAMDGFAARLNPGGTAFNYVTYLGGSGEDFVNGLALDASGNVYIAGRTDSKDFPVVSAIDPVKLGNATSLFVTSDSGATWSQADSHIPGAVLDISFNPSGSSAVALTESGIYRTVNGGSSWTSQLANARFVTGPIGFWIARSPVNPRIIYYASPFSGAFYRSTDDGVTWTSESLLPTAVGGLLADPVTAGTVYVFSPDAEAFERWFYKSVDGGQTWTGTSTALGTSFAQITAMAAASDGSLYLAAYGTGIWKSTDQGSSWLRAGDFESFSLSASGTSVFLAEGNIFRTTDGGATWIQNGSSNIGVYTIAASPQNPSVIYAVTVLGAVLESSDGGVTWNEPGTALPPGVSYSSPQLVPDPANSGHAALLVPVAQEAFVAKLNSTGSALIWSTYLGIAGSAAAVAADGAGNAFVTGDGAAVGFPVTPSPVVGAPSAFITKISDTTDACSVAVTPGNVVTTQYRQTVGFDVFAPSGCPWTASSNQPWAVVTSGASGTGVGLIEVQLAANSNATQSANLTVGSQNITITQAGGSCTYSVDQFSYPVANAGGTVSVMLTAPAGCPWSVVNYDPAELSITSGASGNGSGVIDIRVAANPAGKTQTLDFFAGSAEIIIMQAAPQQAQSQSVTFVRPPSVILGTGPVALHATASSGLPVAFTSNSPRVCTIAGASANPVAAGNCSITATQPGTAAFIAAAATVTFDISAASRMPRRPRPRDSAPQ